MLKYALTASVFIAGTMLAGGAFAQNQTIDMPIAHVANGGHVGNGGCIAPNGCVAVAPTAEIAPPAPPTTTYGAGYGNEPSTWQSSTGGMAASNASEAETYTFALNDLYAHGFHDVRGLAMQNGVVQADAVTPYGHQRTVAVDPSSGQISLG